MKSADRSISTTWKHVLDEHLARAEGGGRSIIGLGQGVFLDTRKIPIPADRPDRDTSIVL